MTLMHNTDAPRIPHSRVENLAGEVFWDDVEQALSLRGVSLNAGLEFENILS